MEEVKNVIVDENEAIINTVEDIAEKSSGKGLKIAGGIGLAVGVGFLAYKFVAKPIIGKIKAKKEKNNTVDIASAVSDEYESNNDDTESFDEN